ncbi:hypothetical protein BF17_22720 [Yersinia similis]|uniref:Uncharacterized protein n=1 Tax=Yersinia similis TaxID=367190 RepID=A0ABN4CSE3_9GAMM|nr:hypothetical protein [Yersinia similis]AHK21756.1 hypothetical protein BF17_22720 [Yersinia similis]CFQ58605.1 Uncharacterised protein [Yersinia similis]
MSLIKSTLIFGVLLVVSFGTLAMSDECKQAYGIFDDAAYFSGKMNVKPGDGKEVTKTNVNVEAFNEWYYRSYDDEWMAVLEKYTKFKGVDDDSVIGISLLAFIETSGLVEFYKSYIDFLTDFPKRTDTYLVSGRVEAAKKKIDDAYKELVSHCNK